MIKSKLATIISLILIWIFYTPALTFIALSGYDFNKSKDHYN